MTTLSTSIIRVPIAVNTDRATSALEAVHAGAGTQWHDLLYGTAGSSSYLARLITRHGEWLTSVADQDPDATFQTILSDLRTATP